MKKLILGSAIAILTVLFVSLIVCICVICRQNKKIEDLEAREPEIKYVEVEVEVEVEPKKIYYGDDEGNVYELIGKAYNKNGVATIFAQDIVTKGVWFEVEHTFLEDHHILEDYEP